MAWRQIFLIYAIYLSDKQQAIPSSNFVFVQSRRRRRRLPVARCACCLFSNKKKQKSLASFFFCFHKAKTNTVRIIGTTRNDGPSWSLLLYDRFTPTKYNGVFIWEEDRRNNKQFSDSFRGFIKRDIVVLHDGDDSVMHGLTERHLFQQPIFQTRKCSYSPPYFSCSFPSYSFFLSFFFLNDLCSTWSFRSSRPCLFPRLLVKA